jgi:hypothetical protein
MLHLSRSTNPPSCIRALLRFLEQIAQGAGVPLQFSKNGAAIDVQSLSDLLA